MLILAVDVGNSSTKFGLFRDRTLRGLLSLPSDRKKPAEHYLRSVKSFLGSQNVSPGDIRLVIMGSVVRKLSGTLKEAFGEAEMVCVNASWDMELGIDLVYDKPSHIGIDRIAAAVGGKELYGLPLVTIGLGTAVTVDITSRNEEFLGGVIAPGPSLAADALSRGTDLLPKVKLKVPPDIFGKSTEDCILSGVTYGIVGMVDWLAAKAKLVVGNDARVVATGGFTELFAPLSNLIDKVDPNLVLKGLNEMALKNLV